MRESLHLKYRPDSLGSVFGNGPMVAKLAALLQRPSEGLPHAWLFHGPSGCGKTTLARIVAATVGCKGQDLVELDSAHFRGIDTVRELRSGMGLSPIYGKRRGWILDECHQLSRDAQSGLLKVLEDTPSHCHFFLATTDPQKLLPTIVNRCMAFQVAPLSDGEMGELLAAIIEAEGLSIPPDAMKGITRESMGSSRAALVLLDGIRDLPEKDMQSAIAAISARENEAIALCHVLFAKKGTPWAAVARVLEGIKQEDPEKVRRLVLAYSGAVLLKRDEPRAWMVLSAFEKPLYDIGFPGLVMAAYAAWSA